MRKLSSEELTNGMFVQCKPSPAIQNVDLVKDNWYETEETKYLNRDNKLKKLGII